VSGLNPGGPSWSLFLIVSLPSSVVLGALIWSWYVFRARKRHRNNTIGFNDPLQSMMSA
jgi:hypothetical protein